MSYLWAKIGLKTKIKLHTMDVEDTSDWSKTKGEKSVTEQSALDEFLTTAEMAGKEFESGKTID